MHWFDLQQKALPGLRVVGLTGANSEALRRIGDATRAIFASDLGKLRRLDPFTLLQCLCKQITIAAGNNRAAIR